MGIVQLGEVHLEADMVVLWRGQKIGGLGLMYVRSYRRRSHGGSVIPRRMVVATFRMRCHTTPAWREWCRLYDSTAGDCVKNIFVALVLVWLAAWAATQTPADIFFM